jgi:O-acetyl-ADP-ribose deacetylase (regulator of RNase III)
MMEKLILVDVNENLCIEWKKVFADFSEIEIVNDKFQNIKTFDCIVSPANSFGLMDGGVDLAIIKFFGKELENSVQRYIVKNYDGEQPIGSTFIIETKNKVHPYLAHTPTMRIPSIISDTENVYYAMKGMLSAVKKFNDPHQKIKTVLCPGLGTATGRVSPKIAAQQMLLAYTFHKKPPEEINWEYAKNKDYEIKQCLESLKI